MVENPWRRVYYIVPQGKKICKELWLTASLAVKLKDMYTIWRSHVSKEGLSEVFRAQLFMSFVINNSILKWIFHLQIWSSPFDRLNGGIAHHFGSHRNASFPNYYYRATFSFAGRLIDSWPKCCHSVNENNTNTSALLNKSFIHKPIHLIISHQLQSICFAAAGTN